MTLPILDLSQAQPLTPEVQTALRDYGSCLVLGHPLAQTLVDEVFQVTTRFFALPTAQKQPLSVLPPPHMRGWSPLPERDGDYRESFFATFGLPEQVEARPIPGQQPWPQQMPELQQILARLAAEIQKVAEMLLPLLANAAGGQGEVFAHMLEAPGGMGVRALRYPPLPPGRVHGVSPHTDLPPLTLLVQNQVDGVEWQSRKGEDRAWQPVQVPPGALILQVGDILARWTNDRLAANLHRVVNRTQQERLSVACFALPAAQTLVHALPGTVPTGEVPRHPPELFGETLHNWLVSLAGDRGEHVYGR